jgi:hypothetical protein
MSEGVTVGSDLEVSVPSEEVETETWESPREPLILATKTSLECI